MMEATRFMEGQKAFVLEQGEEGSPVAEICCKAGYCLTRCAG